MTWVLCSDGVGSSFHVSCASVRSTLFHPNIVLFYGASTRKPDLCLLLEFCVRFQLRWLCLFAWRATIVPLLFYCTLTAQVRSSCRRICAVTPTTTLFSLARCAPPPVPSQDHGDLHAYLQTPQGRATPLSLRAQFALDVARGCLYLHCHKSVMQRDLKLRNVLLDRNLNAKVRALPAAAMSHSVVRLLTSSSGVLLPRARPKAPSLGHSDSLFVRGMPHRLVCCPVPSPCTSLQTPPVVFMEANTPPMCWRWWLFWFVPSLSMSASLAILFY